MRWIRYSWVCPKAGLKIRKQLCVLSGLHGLTLVKGLVDKKAETGDKEAARKLKEMENTQMMEVVNDDKEDDVDNDDDANGVDDDNEKEKTKEK